MKEKAHSFNLNPLIHFPSEICDLIFYQLRGKELLNASEVSTCFYDFIAESQKCMKKIKINLSEKKFTHDDETLMIQSPRKYENMEICYHSSLIKHAAAILLPGGKWKTIILRKVEFETVVHVIQLLRIFENTVENLFMEQIYDKSRSAKVLINLKFPKLKHLEVICCQALLFVEAFKNCKMLTSFKIKSGNRVPSEALKAIKEIMENNVNLEFLEINYNIFYFIFEEDISSRVRFSLKAFHIRDLYQIPGAITVKANLLSFLRSQQSSIKSLTISEWFGIEVIETIFSMTSLENVSLKGFHHAEKTVDWKNIELPQNSLITELTFHDLSNDNLILQKFVSVIPNLKSLKLFTMDQSSMELVSLNCKSLQDLFAEHFLSIDISSKNLFMNLQRVSFKITNGLLHSCSAQERE